MWGHWWKEERKKRLGGRVEMKQGNRRKGIGIRWKEKNVIE
jgi:hypothetical protein